MGLARPRIGVHDAAIARIVATLLFTTPAAAMTYYGAELGMHTRVPQRREEVRDPIGIAGWPREKGRDGERTPMQWTPGAQSGFSTRADTWLPVSPDHATINVQAEDADPDSLLAWYRALIALRRNDPALRDGDLRLVGTDKAVLAYTRGSDVMVAMNMTAEPHAMDLGGPFQTLLASDSALREVSATSKIVLPLSPRGSAGLPASPRAPPGDILCLADVRKAHRRASSASVR